MNTANSFTESNAHTGWRWAVTPRQAQKGIALIVALMAVLGLLSVSFGSSSDSSAPAPTQAVAR